MAILGCVALLTIAASGHAKGVERSRIAMETARISPARSRSTRPTATCRTGADWRRAVAARAPHPAAAERCAGRRRGGGITNAAGSFRPRFALDFGRSTSSRNTVVAVGHAWSGNNPGNRPACRCAEGRAPRSGVHNWSKPQGRADVDRTNSRRFRRRRLRRTRHCHIRRWSCHDRLSVSLGTTDIAWAVRTRVRYRTPALPP